MPPTPNARSVGRATQGSMLNLCRGIMSGIKLKNHTRREHRYLVSFHLARLVPCPAEVAPDDPSA